MNGLIGSPFVEGVCLLILGVVFVVVAHIVNAPDLEPIANMVLGGGLTYLGLAKVNQGAK